MIRGSTPTHVFRLPINTELIKALRITYVQKQKTVLEKTEQDVTMDGTTISLRLTQEETLAFNAECRVKIQLKVLTVNEEVLASRITEVFVEQVLNEEVLE